MTEAAATTTTMMTTSQSKKTLAATATTTTMTRQRSAARYRTMAVLRAAQLGVAAVPDLALGVAVPGHSYQPNAVYGCVAASAPPPVAPRALVGLGVVLA